jgi:outer membrane protein
MRTALRVPEITFIEIYSAIPSFSWLICYQKIAGAKCFITVFVLLYLPCVNIGNAGDFSKWQVRVGGYHLKTDLKDQPIEFIPGSGTQATSDTTLGLTVTYFFNEHVGLEILANPPFDYTIYGTKSLSGSGDLISLKSFGPTLLGQWYLTKQEKRFRPYLGLGLSYAIFFDEETTPALDAIVGEKIDVDVKNQLAIIGQAGLDIRITDNWIANGSIAYLSPETDVVYTSSLGSQSSSVTIDSWVYGFGIGYRF